MSKTLFKKSFAQLKLEMEGEQYRTVNCGELEVIRYEQSQRVLVRFLKTGYERYTTRDGILLGKVGDPWYPNIFGLGFIGEGRYKGSENGKLSEAYIKWYGMLERCYCPIYRFNKRTYEGCTVDESWYNFQNFAAWFEAYKEKEKGWHLDKDLIYTGNKMYSEERCCIIPNDINILFQKHRESDLPAGVSRVENRNFTSYKSQISEFGRKICIGTFRTVEEASFAYNLHKKGYITEVANLWKSRISSRVYNSMLQRAKYFE